MNRKLMQRYKNILSEYPGYFFSSLSPPRFSLSCSHFLSLEKWKTTSTKKSIEKQHKVHPSHRSGWQFKGALPTCNPVVCFKNSVCPRKKRRANPGSRSFPKGSFFLSLQPVAFAWDSVLWADSFFKLSHWFFTFVGSWKKNEAVGWGRDSILPG